MRIYLQMAAVREILSQFLSQTGFGMNIWVAWAMLLKGNRADSGEKIGERGESRGGSIMRPIPH